MCKVSDRSEPDRDICLEGEDGYVGDVSGWETTDFEVKTNYKVTRDVVTIISNKVSLDYLFTTKYNLSLEERYSPSGWHYYCRCPFKDHRDSSPSFHYNKEEDRFFCFGCKRGGRSVQFVSFMENITINEAVDKLLEITGAVDEIFTEIHDVKDSKVDDLLYEFSTCIREFIKNHKDTEAVSFAESVTWALDIYLQKHLPRSTIDETNLKARLALLSNKLDSYGK